MRKQTLLLIGCAALAAAWIDLRLTGPSDYTGDAGPGVDALAAGRLGDFVHLQAIMGPLTIYLRAPFVAVAHALGAGPLTSYKVGTYPCLLSGGLLGVWLARRLAWALAVLTVILATATPPVVSAAQYGHPEEVVCAVLCVVAVLLAQRQRVYQAAAVLALAVAAKQSGLLAAPAVLVALERHRIKAMFASGGVAAALYAPWVIGDWHAFRSVSHKIDVSTTRPKVGNWWRLLVGRQLPLWLYKRTHAAIIVSAFAIAAAAWKRVRKPDALALLSLFFLLRCVLDQSNDYYKHIPLVLALLAWETDSRRRAFPFATVFAVVWLIVTFSYVATPQRPELIVAGTYFAGTAPLAAYLAYCALSRRARPPATAAAAAT